MVRLCHPVLGLTGKKYRQTEGAVTNRDRTFPRIWSRTSRKNGPGIGGIVPMRNRIPKRIF